MNKKTIRRVNGGIAIYYGVGSAITALMAAIATIVWLFKVFTDQAIFAWGILVGLIFITVAMAAIAYAILRVGFEQVEGRD
jgi:hypothetical protein